MVWLTVDKDGIEKIFSREPIRDCFRWVRYVTGWGEPYGSVIEIPKGTIKKLIGRELTWKEEPFNYE